MATQGQKPSTGDFVGTTPATGATLTTSRATENVNVHSFERMASAAIGGAMLMRSLGRRRSFGGRMAMMLAGGELLYRGVKGHCHVYQALGTSTAEDPNAVGGAAAANQVERFITIARPAEELYRLWREPGTLSRVMGHFAEVSQPTEDSQHWVVHGPFGRMLQWDSRVVEDQPGESLRWESMAGADLPNEGSVRFQPALADRGTEVRLWLRFHPPGGALGDAAMKLLGFVPGMLAQKALYRFKSLAETGEIATLERNPSARSTV